MTATTSKQQKPKLRAVFFEGRFLLFDMYVAGQWHGSRRTYDQCLMYLNSEMDWRGTHSNKKPGV